MKRIESYLPGNMFLVNPNRLTEHILRESYKVGFNTKVYATEPIVIGLAPELLKDDEIIDLTINLN